jgi:phosphoglucosamine mutase
MITNLFGTDGVRGIAGQYPLDIEGAQAIGAAVGHLFDVVGRPVLIGCDTRESSIGLVDQLTTGLIGQGAKVIQVGVVTTPGLAYLTREQPVAAGVMVTASHNPYQYNGIKVFDGNGDKLPDSTEAALNDLIEYGVQRQTTGSSLWQPELVKLYEDFLVESAAGLSLAGWSIGVDTANGSASGIAGRVFTRLGARITELFNTPDGRNINDHCGATDTEQLQKAVTSQHLKLGIAFDGDADRLIMVDEKGREAKGDHLLYLLAVHNHVDGVVATIMSNLGFEQALQKKHIPLIRSAVGDRYVLEELAKTGYHLGGEQSGHVVLPDLLQTGDGLLAAVQVLRVLVSSGKTLADWCDEVMLLPQALVNVHLADKGLLARPDIQAFISIQTKQFGTDGRLNIRPSGTEPLVRVMVEASDAQNKAQRIANQLDQLLAKES